MEHSDPDERMTFAYLDKDVVLHAISGNGNHDKSGNDEKVSGQITRGIVGVCCNGVVARGCSVGHKEAACRLSSKWEWRLVRAISEPDSRSKRVSELWQRAES